MRSVQKRSFYIAQRLIAFGAVFALLAMAAAAYAHAAVLWAYAEKDRVYVEAFFVGGAKVQHQRVVVVDAKGEKLLEGKTDNEGKFEFDPPTKDTIKIILLIDKAHSAEFELTKQDFKEAEASK